MAKETKKTAPKAKGAKKEEVVSEAVETVDVNVKLTGELESVSELITVPPTEEETTSPGPVEEEVSEEVPVEHEPEEEVADECPTSDTDETEETDAPEVDEETTDSDINDAINEFLGQDTGEKLQNLVNENPDNLVDALTAEKERVEQIEKKVREEVKKTEEKIKKKRKVTYIYQDSLGHFWNGMSDGWNN